MWDRLSRRHSPRAWVLLFGSLIAVTYGIAYTPLSNLPAHLPLGLDVVSLVIPLWVFGLLWLTFGLGGIVVFVIRRTGTWAFAGQFGLFISWAVSYGIAWGMGDPRAWISAALSGGVAGMIANAMRVEPPMWFRRLTWKQ